nr:cation-translocating P-type ATPase [Lachnospiraceae bacterium]
FDSKKKYSEVITKECTYRLGAPEFLLSEEQLEDNKEVIEKRTGRGMRVLAFVKEEEGKVSPLLFVALVNELRANVQEIFASFKAQGVGIKVISGDNPLTVSRVAAKAGVEHANEYIDLATVESDEELKECATKYTVFGRVKPEQKKALVTALHEEGLKVAMTGDGVNDILAMKEADCSIAMGTGSDAARQAAQVVLLDSDFSHMKEIVSEGRRDINNITRSATLFLYKNIFSLLLAVFSIILSMTYPLRPNQVSLISGFNIGIPAFLLALEPNEKKQHGSFIIHTLVKAIPASLTSFFAIAFMVFFGQLFNIPQQEIGTASTYLLSVIGFVILWDITKPMNKWRTFVFFVCIAGFILSNIFLYKLFDMTNISLEAAALCVVFAIAEMTIIRWLTFLCENMIKNKTIRKIFKRA